MIDEREDDEAPSLRQWRCERGHVTWALINPESCCATPTCRQPIVGEVLRG